jgi:hypothetical protein
MDNNINNKKSSKLQETREFVKRINSKVKSNSNKDFEFSDFSAFDKDYINNAVCEKTNKINQEKNIINEKLPYKSGSRRIADESKSNHFSDEESNRKIIYNKNRNGNYASNIYSVKINDNNGNKSINNGSVVSNSDKNNQENSNFNYSMSKTEGEVYLDK